MLWAIWTQGHFLSVDVFDKTKYQGPFDMDQISPEKFWVEPNVLQETKWICVHKCLYNNVWDTLHDQYVLSIIYSLIHVFFFVFEFMY